MMVISMRSSTTKDNEIHGKDIPTVDNKNNIHIQKYSSSMKLSELHTDTVSTCLTDDCKDCTGSYINELLGHKLLCHCLCHREGEGEGEVVGAK